MDPAHICSVFNRVVSSGGRNTSEILGGCDGIDSSGEEGAGAAAAVDQAAVVHGASGSWLEYPGRGSWGRGRAYDRDELGSGYKTYRKGGVVGWVPPLDPQAVRHERPRDFRPSKRSFDMQMPLVTAQAGAKSPNLLTNERSVSIMT